MCFRDLRRNPLDATGSALLQYNGFIYNSLCCICDHGIYTSLGHSGEAYIAYDAWSNNHKVGIEQLTPDYLNSRGAAAVSLFVYITCNTAPTGRKSVQNHRSRLVRGQTFSPISLRAWVPVLTPACACPYEHTLAMLLLPYARALPPSESEKHPNTDYFASHHVIVWRPLARYHQRGMKLPSSSKGRDGTTCFLDQPAAFAPLALVPKYGPQEACSVSSGHHCIVSLDTLTASGAARSDSRCKLATRLSAGRKAWSHHHSSFFLVPRCLLLYSVLLAELVFCFIALPFDD